MSEGIIMEFKCNDRVVTPMGLQMIVTEDSVADSKVVECMVQVRDGHTMKWTRTLANKEVLRLVGKGVK
jgi:hypothetical protein